RTWSHGPGAHRSRSSGQRYLCLSAGARRAPAAMPGLIYPGELIMPTKRSVVPPEIYQLKVTLFGTSPPIWRRLLVPADLTLAQLHDVLQAAMGWQGCHMHEFSGGQRRFGQPT